MTNMPNPAGWRQKVFQAVLLLLVVALGARVAANLLAPIVPGLVVIAMLCGIGWFILGRRR
jgi:hypothetical protein